MDFLDPKKVLQEAGLQPGIIVADFGAGTGFFSMPAARLVGPTGRVYAIDILPEIAALLRSRAKLERLSNIEVRQSDLGKKEGSTLPAESCDLIIVSNILFQSEKKEAILEEAARILKAGGRLLLAEWYPEKMPTKEGLHPITPEETKKLVANSPFSLEKEFAAGEFHYGLLFVKISKS